MLLTIKADVQCVRCLRVSPTDPLPPAMRGQRLVPHTWSQVQLTSTRSLSPQTAGEPTTTNFYLCGDCSRQLVSFLLAGRAHANNEAVNADDAGAQT